MISFIADRLKEPIKDGVLCPGIYLHGLIHDLNGFDIVRAKSKHDIDLLERSINDQSVINVTVDVFGKVMEAIAYLWDCDGVIRGLIVLPDDTKYKIDAQRKMENKVKNI